MLELDLAELQTRLALLGRAYTPRDVADILRSSGVVVTDSLMHELLTQLRCNSTGAGPLDELLQQSEVSDVLVNGPRAVFVDRGSGLERVDIAFVDDEQVRRLALRLAAAAGKRLDDASPHVDGRLPNGVRLHAILAPLAHPGTCISLRVPASRTFSLADLVEAGSICREGAQILTGIITNRVPFLISGGTGTGKTTLLAALLAEIPDTERIIVVEDARELQLNHPHVVSLEARAANAEGAGAIPLTNLVKQALRMRPDRVVLGEVRGAELTDLLTALNTGHEGGCGTVHANSVRDIPARLEALAALGGLDRQACQAQVVAALRAVIHIRRDRAGHRLIDQIGLFTRSDSDQLEVRPAATFTPGKVQWHGELGEQLRTMVGLPC